MPAGIRYAKISVQDSGAQRKPTRASKLCIGFIVAPKAHDPIPKGTQERNWPDAFKIKNNTGPNAPGWGGQFHIDVAIPLRLARLYSEIIAIDIIPGEEVTHHRLAQNHLNFNLGYDLVNAFMSMDKCHYRTVEKALRSRGSRLWPEWDLQNWIYRKDLYLQACRRAKIPIIDTIFVTNGIVGTDVLRSVCAMGWDRFFIKPSFLGSFGLSAGKFETSSCVEDPSILDKFQEETGKGYSCFLVQRYMTKPDGKVFDEIRNFFIDGEWAYAVYTDGTDDDAVYEQPKGALLDAAREIAGRAYRELLKVARWRRAHFVPPITRVDVGVLPANGEEGAAFQVFVNEIEMEAATLLPRYCPFDLVQRLCEVYPHKIVKLLTSVLASHEHLPGRKKVQKLTKLLDQRLRTNGIKEATSKRKPVRNDESAEKRRKQIVTAAEEV